MPPKSPPAAMEWSLLQPHDVICSERVPFCHCWRVTGVHSAFFVLGDLDLWPWHSNSFKQGTEHVSL